MGARITGCFRRGNAFHLFGGSLDVARFTQRERLLEFALIGADSQLFQFALKQFRLLKVARADGVRDCRFIPGRDPSFVDEGGLIDNESKAADDNHDRKNPPEQSSIPSPQQRPGEHERRKNGATKFGQPRFLKSFGTFVFDLLLFQSLGDRFSIGARIDFWPGPSWAQSIQPPRKRHERRQQSCQYFS